MIETTIKKIFGFSDLENHFGSNYSDSIKTIQKDEEQKINPSTNSKNKNKNNKIEFLNLKSKIIFKISPQPGIIKFQIYYLDFEIEIKKLILNELFSTTPNPNSNDNLNYNEKINNLFQNIKIRFYQDTDNCSLN